MAHVHDPSKQHGNGAPKPGQPRQSLAAASAAVKPPASPVIEHAKEIMDRLIPLRSGYTPEGIASEAFNLARAFAAEAAKEPTTQTKTE